MPTASVAPGPACCRRRSRKRPRPISSASRPCSAAAPPNSWSGGFETLVEAGYQPEVAYFECLHELKLIVDLLHEGGIWKMHKFISESPAKYGDLTRGPRVVNSRTKAEMRKILKEIQQGQFARQWIRENATGRKKYDKMLETDLNRQIEKVGFEVARPHALARSGSLSRTADHHPRLELTRHDFECRPGNDLRYHAA
jgi:hypothetical protein